MRQPISLSIPDVSGFAKALRLDAPGTDAGHQSWLNHIARAAGFRNYQHLSAVRKDAEPPADPAKVTRALRWFDEQGRFARWPSKQSVRELCLWAIWARLPAGQVWDERGVSERIDALTALQDAAQIRRSFIEMGLFTRNIDGTGYTRVERRPPPEARALIAVLGEKSAA